jgi:hypothetical protein
LAESERSPDREETTTSLEVVIRGSYRADTVPVCLASTTQQTAPMQAMPSSQPSALEAQITDRCGLLPSQVQLAELLGRTPGGLRYSLSYPRDDRTRTLRACGCRRFVIVDQSAVEDIRLSWAARVLTGVPWALSWQAQLARRGTRERLHGCSGAGSWTIFYKLGGLQQAASQGG